MSEITNHIEQITGVATANTDFIESAQRFVSSSIPSDLMLWAITETVPGTHGGNTSNQQITLPVKTDSLIFVRRDQFEAKIVDGSMRGFIGNTSSLYEATATFPKYYIADGNRVIVKPDPDNTYTAHAQYVDYSKINEDSDLRNAVIFHACSSEFSKLASSKVTDWTDLAVPVPPSSPSFGSDLSISSSAPVAPSLSSNSVSFSTSVPTYTAPVMQAPDWSDVENWKTAEEDSEMLSSRIQAIQSQVAEYQVRLGEAESRFNKENAEYQAQLQVSIQNSQLEDANDSRLLQKYASELQSYQAEISKEIEDFNNTLNKEIQEYQNKLGLYGNELQKYQMESAEQAQKIASATQNSAFYSNESKKYYEWAKLEVSSYIQNNSKMISATMAAQAAQQQG